MLTFSQTFLLTAMKIWIRCGTEHMWYHLVIDVLPGFMTMGICAFDYMHLSRAKRRCRNWLEEQLNSPDIKQQQVAQRLLKKHYGIHFKVESRGDSSQAPSQTVQVKEEESLRACTERCAELARELQLWQVQDVFQD